MQKFKQVFSYATEFLLGLNPWTQSLIYDIQPTNYDLRLTICDFVIYTAYIYTVSQKNRPHLKRVATVPCEI